MMRVHHGDEVAVDIAARLDRHVVHHFGHGVIVLFQERGLAGRGRCRLCGGTGFLREQMRRKGECDQKTRCEDGSAETATAELAWEDGQDPAS